MKRTTIMIVALLAATVGLRAQQEGGYNESVVVRGSYRPDIQPSEKLNFPAVVSDSLGRMEHSFVYSIAPTRLKTLYEPTRIKAARIVGEPTTRLYNNYLRLGMGNYWSPLADLYWSSTRDRLKTYGIRVNHRSSWASLPPLWALSGPSLGPLYPYQANQTGVTLFGKYIVADKLQLSSDLSYEHDHNLYYGFSDSILSAVLGQSRDSISTSDYRASYNVATWNFGVSNMQLDVNKLGYAAKVHLSDLWATYGRNEFHLNLSGNVHYGFNIKNHYKGVAYMNIEWDGFANRINHNGQMPLGYGFVNTSSGYITLPAPTDTVRSHRNIVKINPYVDFDFRGLNFHAGFTTAWDGFSDTAVAFRLFPDVVASKKLMKDNLVLSLGLTGGIDANSWNTIRIINPYIAPDADRKATSHYDFAFHARWSISKKLEANAEVALQIMDNDLTFSLDRLYGLENVYKPLYIDNNRFVCGGTITFVNDEMLTMRAGGHYYHYSDLKDDGNALALTEMPYRPNWDALLAADVNYKDKWFFHLEGQLLGKMFGDNGDVLPMRYGVNVEIEYRHNRALSFFLKMDNLAFQRYWLWSNYPSQRGLFTLGLTYTIPHK